MLGRARHELALSEAEWVRADVLDRDRRAEDCAAYPRDHDRLNSEPMRLRITK
jgi:hypothetical protein